MNLFSRNTPSVLGSRDYLQNLYDHLKGLAFVVTETEAKSSGKVTGTSDMVLKKKR